MSDYAAFRLMYNDENGRLQAFPEVEVLVRSSDDDYATDIDTLETDVNGEIAAGTLAVPIGTRVRFRVENYLGLAASLTQITT
jgi:hypothetical protein